MLSLGEAQRAADEALDPGPEIDVLALDLLGMLLPYGVLRRIKVPRSASSCLGWSIGRAAILTTGVRTRIGQRGSASTTCRGSNPPDMRSAFCQPTDPLPNTFARDDICCPRPYTGKRCGNDSRAGPRARARSGLLQGREGQGAISVRPMSVAASTRGPYLSEPLRL